VLSSGDAESGRGAARGAVGGIARVVSRVRGAWRTWLVRRAEAEARRAALTPAHRGWRANGAATVVAACALPGPSILCWGLWHWLGCNLFRARPRAPWRGSWPLSDGLSRGVKLRGARAACIAQWRGPDWHSPWRPVSHWHVLRRGSGHVRDAMAATPVRQGRAGRWLRVGTCGGACR